MYKKVKTTITISIVAAIIAILSFVAFKLLSYSNPATKEVSLGEKYLNEMKYSEAIAQFSTAILSDPYNKEAYIGLANAYQGNNQTNKAINTLENTINKQTVDIKLSESLSDIYIQAGNISGAIQITDELIDATDEDKYYEKLDKLLQDYYKNSNMYSIGHNHQLLIKDGVVLSKGNNIFGQLGTDTKQEQTDFADAKFPNKAISVYCIGNTSYVIDENYNLWGCGENRFGQLAVGYSTIETTYGWQQITDSNDVVKVAGENGYVLVLKKDGSLFSCGNAEGQTLIKQTKLSKVIDIKSKDNYLGVLTTDGTLYTKDTRNLPSDWKISANNISAYDIVYDDYIISLKRNGTLYENNLGENSQLSFLNVASAGKILYLQDTYGKLWKMEMGANTLQDVALEGEVLSLCSCKNIVIVKFKDNNIGYFDETGFFKTL